MLQTCSKRKNEKSRYLCDSCDKELLAEERIVIYKEINYKKQKKYDLCRDCWRRIRIIVEKHKLKKEV